MSTATESDERHGAAEEREQKELTSRLGAPLTRQPATSNRKWSTWKSRLGMDKEAK